MPHVNSVLRVRKHFRAHHFAPPLERTGTPLVLLDNELAPARSRFKSGCISVKRLTYSVLRVFGDVSAATGRVTIGAMIMHRLIANVSRC